MWKSIDSRNDLPSIGDPETLYLDFKAAPTDSAFEIGKDVAAMANASGGTLLVGAAEASGGRLKQYVPLKDAAATEKFYENVIRDRCRPRPTVTLNIVECDDSGGAVLAVNVQPFPGQPVGVHIPVKEQQGMKSIEDLFHYPIRVNTYTKAILPETLAMYVDARVRRISILLEPLVGSQIRVQSTKPTGENCFYMDLLVLKGVSLPENTVELELEGKSYFIPIDFIHCVHRSGSLWHIFIRGKFDELEWDGSDLPTDLKSHTTVFLPF